MKYRALVNMEYTVCVEVEADSVEEAHKKITEAPLPPVTEAEYVEDSFSILDFPARDGGGIEAFPGQRTDSLWREHSDTVHQMVEDDQKVEEILIGRKFNRWQRGQG
jgi:hypothetical protein